MIKTSARFFSLCCGGFIVTGITVASVSLDSSGPQALKDGKIDVLFVNAGIYKFASLAASNESFYDEIFDINTKGAYFTIQKALPFLNEGASIILNTSVAGSKGFAGSSAYSATKAALHSYTLSQRYRLRDIGIRVIEIAPPWVRTELLNSLEEDRAMPLDAFIAATMAMLATDADEVLVGQAPQMRANPGPQEHVWVNQFNDLIAAGPPLG